MRIRRVLLDAAINLEVVNKLTLYFRKCVCYT